MKTYLQNIDLKQSLQNKNELTSEVVRSYYIWDQGATVWLIYLQTFVILKINFFMKLLFSMCMFYKPTSKWVFKDYVLLRYRFIQKSFAQRCLW